MLKKNNQQRNKTLELGRQHRTITLRAENVNEDDRTIELSFSSEAAVERWWGMEILGHEADEIDLSRLNNAHPFLMDHRLSDQRGVVEKAWIDGKTGRAIVRLSKNERGTELLNDMRDGIRTLVSVGYELTEILHVKRDDNDVDWYRCKWAPYEISSVSVPADTSVGVGRSSDDTDENKRTFTIQLRGTEVDPKDKDKTPAEPKAPVIDNRGTSGGGDKPPPKLEVGIDAERERCREINALGRQFGLDRDADSAIQSGVQADEFRKIVLKNVRSGGQDKPAGTDIILGLSDDETKRYSLLSAVRAQISGNWKNAGFEREVSIALADKMGKDARGFFVNYEVLGKLGRAGQAGNVSGKGAELVANELHSEQFIDLLRPKSVAAKLGVRFATGLVGNVDIPKMLSGSSFYWIDEGGDGTESDSSFGIVQMSPKTIAGAVPITRRLMMQSTPDIDLLLRDDLLKGLALAIDKAIIAGSGTGFEPKGIINQTGVNAVDLNTLGMSWPAMVEFETQIAEANADSDSIAYLARASTRGMLKTTEKSAGTAKYLWDDNEVNGYPSEISQWLAAKAILAGDFSQAMVGFWGALDLVADKSTKAASGGTVLRVFQDADVAVRNAQAFSYGVKTI